MVQPQHVNGDLLPEVVADTLEVVTAPVIAGVQPSPGELVEVVIVVDDEHVVESPLRDEPGDVQIASLDLGWSSEDAVDELDAVDVSQDGPLPVHHLPLPVQMVLKATNRGRATFHIAARHSHVEVAEYVVEGRHRGHLVPLLPELNPLPARRALRQRLPQQAGVELELVLDSVGLKQQSLHGSSDLTEDLSLTNAIERKHVQAAHLETVHDAIEILDATPVDALELVHLPSDDLSPRHLPHENDVPGVAVPLGEGVLVVDDALPGVLLLLVLLVSPPPGGAKEKQHRHPDHENESSHDGEVHVGGGLPGGVAGGHLTRVGGEAMAPGAVRAWLGYAIYQTVSIC